MITLTFRDAHNKPKKVFKEWQQKQPWCDTDAYCFAWWMEFQRRGVVHFHYILGLDAFAALVRGTPHWWQTYSRGKPPQRVDVLRGSPDDWLVGSWSDSVGDTSKPFLALQRGGICEKLRSPEGAGRYAAKYAGKKQQKQLPPDQAPLGRWWYISRKATPQPISVSPLVAYPYPVPYKYLHDGSEITTEEEEKEHDIQHSRNDAQIHGSMLDIRRAEGQWDEAGGRRELLLPRRN